jgi:hypothetical protein
MNIFILPYVTIICFRKIVQETQFYEQLVVLFKNHDDDDDENISPHEQ